MIFRVITVDNIRYTVKDEKSQSPQDFLNKHWFLSGSSMKFLDVGDAIINLNHVVAIEEA